MLALLLKGVMVGQLLFRGAVLIDGISLYYNGTKYSNYQGYDPDHQKSKIAQELAKRDSVTVLFI